MPRSRQRSAAWPIPSRNQAQLSRVRRLKRVVVALDPRPDDEVGAELAGEVDRVKRLSQRLRPRRGVRRDEAASAEARIEVHTTCKAVDVMPVQGAADLVQVVLRQLLRVVELVAVDQVSETLDSLPYACSGGFAQPLRLVTTRHKACDHGPKRPDS